MPIRLVRVMTSLAVIAASAWTAVLGAKIIAFHAMAMVAPENPSRASAVFSETLGLRLTARAAMSGEGMEAVIARETAILQVAPLHGESWLMLAEARARQGAFPQAAAAFAMSALAAPNEGHLMLARAALGITLWPDLSVASKRAALADLTAKWREASEARWARMAFAAADLPPAPRQDLAAMLSEKADGAAMAAALHLQPAAP